MDRVETMHENGGATRTSWPSDPDDAEDFAVVACDAIRRRGFCTITVADPEEIKRGVARSAPSRDYVLPKPEFVEAYFGRDAECKAAWLERISEQAGDDPLTYYLDRATDLVSMLHGGLTEFCGFSPWGLSNNSMLRTPLANTSVQLPLGEEPLSAEDVEDGVVEQHLEFIQRRRLCLLYPIDSRGGVVTLLPREDLSLQPETLSLEPDEILIFRHDLIGFTYTPRSPVDLLLQTWVLDQPQQLKLEVLEGDKRGLQAILGGPPTPPHTDVHVMNGHCKFPGSGYYIDRAWLAWSTQCDAFTVIPMSRWDVDLYYSEDLVPGKAATKHSAMLDFNEITAFDNSFFQLTDTEAYLIPPGQRVLMEITLESVKMGLGLSKQELRGRPVACCIGDIGSDWGFFQFKDGNEKEWLKVGGVGNSQLSAARLACTFGITGPVVQVDTACSSSLVGANLMHALVRKHEKGVTEAISQAYINFFSPFAFVGLSAAGMLGRSGRSLTFDQAANGYNRGEGIGGIILKSSDSFKDFENRVASFVTGFTNQDGRSASLTAPNGPSQQACMRGSMRDMNLQPEDLAMTENHGTGTALGDPIEVGSIRAIFGRRKGPPIPVTSGKTHMGHLESGAGSVGLLKVIASLAHMADAPNCHLRHLNAHIEVEGFPVHFPIELLDVGLKEGMAGMNSFGFGGTNSRAELWARCLSGPRRQSPWSHDVRKLDFVTVPCARCLGPMCWLCGVSVPDTARKGKHHCSAVREELASYEYCSNCFGGSYSCGNATVEVIAESNGQPYLTGTWSKWSSFEEMEFGPGSSYIAHVVLGETLCERFRIVLGKDRHRAIYPVTPRSSSDMRVLGPDGNNAGEDWLIDGRRDGALEGSVYRVVFEWGTLNKSIRWELVRDEVPPLSPSGKHSYWICGSLTAWRPLEMSPDPEKPGHWHFTGQIPKMGKASFTILRDNDATQTLYPLETTSSDRSVPIMGPGDGQPLAESFQHWQLEGAPAASSTVQLEVLAGRFCLTASVGLHDKVTTWHSPQDLLDRYFVVGSFNGWSFSPMDRSDESPNIQRLQFTIGPRGFTQFQIVLNRNWETRLYPSHANAAPGFSLVLGPGPKGNNMNWMVSGLSGQIMEVILDLASEDRSGLVTCQPLA